MAYGEFKGSTDAKLKIIFDEITKLREEVAELTNHKFWTIGLGAGAGLVASLLFKFLGR